MTDEQRNLVRQINYERKEDYRTSVEIKILSEHPEVDDVYQLNFYLEKEGLCPYENVSEEEEREIWDAILRNIDHYEEYGTSIKVPVFSNK